MTATVRLPHPAAYQHALQQMKTCCQAGIAWDEVTWSIGQDYSDACLNNQWPKDMSHMPHDFLKTASLALLHSDEDRFLRVHAMFERIANDPRHWLDVLHPEHVHLVSLARQVRHDMHKMKAFVRFTRVRSEDGQEYLAWFEPRHFITQATAGFFRLRFAAMRWTVLTPSGSVSWDGQQLVAGPAARRSEAPPADASETLWLTYYERIFNPARIKLEAMRKEMPLHYWRNLPEARRIPAMLAGAGQRVDGMLRHADAERDKPRSDKKAHERTLSPLSVLTHAVQRCEACALALHATQAVMGSGSPQAAVMFVGEQPGDLEDLQGLPFVGPAGQMLRAAIDFIGLGIDQAYFTNAVKHFKYAMRGKRRIHKSPGQHEIMQCRPWLQEEIRLVSPAVIVALGRTAEKALMTLFPPAANAWTSATGAPIVVVAHPAALLRAGETVGSAGFMRWATQIGNLISHSLPEATSRLSSGPPGLAPTG